MTTTIKVSIPLSYRIETMDHLGLGEAYPGSIYGRMLRQLQSHTKGRFYMELSEDDLRYIISECQGSIEIYKNEGAGLTTPYRNMMRHAEKKLEQLKA